MSLLTFPFIDVIVPMSMSVKPSEDESPADDGHHEGLMVL